MLSLSKWVGRTVLSPTLVADGEFHPHPDPLSDWERYLANPLGRFSHSTRLRRYTIAIGRKRYWHYLLDNSPRYRAGLKTIKIDKTGASMAKANMANANTGKTYTE